MSFMSWARHAVMTTCKFAGICKDAGAGLGGDSHHLYRLDLGPLQVRRPGCSPRGGDPSLASGCHTNSTVQWKAKTIVIAEQAAT